MQVDWEPSLTYALDLRDNLLAKTKLQYCRTTTQNTRLPGFRLDERIRRKGYSKINVQLFFLTKRWSSVYHHCHRGGVDCLPWQIQNGSAPVFFKAR